MAFIVEAKPVDDGVIIWQAENTRAWITALRTRGDRADFCEAETDFQKRIRHFGILVIACGHAQRVRELQSCNLNRKRRVIGAVACNDAGFKTGNGQTMRLLGIEREQCTSPDKFKKPAHLSSSSGKIWRPSLSSGKGSTFVTADIGSAA